MSIEKFEDIKKVSHKGITQLSYELTPIFQNDPCRAPLYALMVVIYKGINTKKKIYDYFKYFYVNEFSYVKLTQSIVNELIFRGIDKGLIEKKEDKFYLTTKGNKILIKAKKVVLVTTGAIRIFFSEKVVLLFSLACLVFLSSFKIFVGLNTGSDALLSEGVENFTDIIKIIIISLSIKFKRDKLGAIIIIILMLATGLNLVISSIISLIENSLIRPNYFAFVLMLISIMINLMLLILKNFVGKLTGNFSLLSDAKDNINNIRLSAGVIIGLTFAIFNIYLVDSIIGILIASLIIYDGIETLMELVKSGDDIEIDTFKLRLDEAFEFKIADWLLMTIHEEGLDKEELNQKFIEAIEKAYEIYDVWAIFGLYNIKKYGIYKVLNLMEKRKLFNEKNGKSFLTDKGKKQYNRAISQEQKRVSREMKKYKNWKPTTKIIKYLWGVLGVSMLIVIIFLLIFIGPILYDFIISLLKG